MGEQRTDPEKMMDLLAEAFAPKKRRCPFGKLLDEMVPDLRELVTRLLANPEVSTRKIHRALSAAGASIGRDGIADHRDNRCACGGRG